MNDMSRGVHNQNDLGRSPMPLSGVPSEYSMGSLPTMPLSGNFSPQSHQSSSSHRIQQVAAVPAVLHVATRVQPNQYAVSAQQMNASNATYNHNPAMYPIQSSPYPTSVHIATMPHQYPPMYPQIYPQMYPQSYHQSYPPLNHQAPQSLPSPSTAMQSQQGNPHYNAELHSLQNSTQYSQRKPQYSNGSMQSSVVHTAHAPNMSYAPRQQAMHRRQSVVESKCINDEISSQPRLQKTDVVLSMNTSAKTKVNNVLVIGNATNLNKLCNGERFLGDDLHFHADPQWTQAAHTGKYVTTIKELYDKFSLCVPPCGKMNDFQVRVTNASPLRIRGYVLALAHEPPGSYKQHIAQNKAKKKQKILCHIYNCHPAAIVFKQSTLHSRKSTNANKSTPFNKTDIEEGDILRGLLLWSRDDADWSFHLYSWKRMNKRIQYEHEFVQTH